MTVVNVVANLLAIPDGMVEDELHLTVQVMPWNDPLLAGIPLEDWPEAIACLAGRMRVTVAGLDGSQPVTHPCASELTGFLADPHPGGGGLSRREAVTRLWQRIFTKPGFPALHDAIGKAGNEAAQPKTHARTGAVLEPVFRTSGTADLSVLLEAGMAALDHAEAQGEGKEEVWQTLFALFARDDLAAGAALHVTGGDSFAARTQELGAIDALALQLREPTPDALAAPTRMAAFRTAKAMIARVDAALEPDEPDFPEEMEDDVEEPVVEDAETAKRKLGAIASIPTLAHYFGLAIQLTLPIGAMKAPSATVPRANGKLRVEFVLADGSPAPGQQSAWTAFELARPHFAVLADPGQTDAVVHPYSQGLLKLGVTAANGAPRYRVDCTDIVNMLQRLRLALQKKRPHETDLERLRRGLALFDRYKKERLEQQTIRERELEALGGGDAPLFLADLLVGFRPDIAVTMPGATTLNVDVSRWCSTTHRQVRCEDPVEKLIDEAFYKEPAIERIAHHDHGLAMAPRYEKTGKADEPDIIGAEDEIVTWAGESLALSSGDPEGIKVCPEKDLGISIEYDFEAGAEARLPPLREGYGYVFGARLVFPNGVSRKFPDCAPLYATSSDLLVGGVDQTGRKPFTFPPAELPAPQIHLRETDPLVVAATAAERRKLAGEASDRLVVRDNEAATRRVVTRLLLPPRIAFDRAEGEGQFDRTIETIPEGAFANRVHVRTFLPAPDPGLPPGPQPGAAGAEGVFPEARLGAIWHVEGAADDSPEGTWTNVRTGAGRPDPLPAEFQSRGTVALLSTRKPEDNGRFYTSKNGRTLEATLTAARLDGSAVEGAASVSRDGQFWQAGQDHNGALPIVLELSRSTQPGARFRASPFVPVQVGPVTLPSLNVELGPAETYQLTLKPKSARPGGRTATLLLVHALRKPARAPAAAPRMPAGLGINGMTVTVRKSDPTGPTSVGGLPTWEEVVAAQPTSQDMLDWKSSEGGSISFFVGRVDIDRKSTGKLRCDAAWDDYGPTSVTRLDDLRWVKRTPRQHEMLFDIEIVEQGGDLVDLLDDETGKKRALSRSFPDGRARRLETSLNATSRFAAFFDGDNERTSAALEIWTECTFRPPPPAIDRIVPVFDWKVTRRSAQRDANRLRIYLDEGWYASGEGETLALVLKPATTTATAPFERFLSRAGADPIRPGEHERSYLTATDFYANNPVRNLQLVLNDESAVAIQARQGRAGTSGAVSCPVDILPLVVQTEAETGALYCEIRVKPGAAYTPFLQIGLVRYQSHAAPSLELSPPIQQQAQLLPSRSIEITEAPTGRMFRMKGPGYQSVGPAPRPTRTTVDLRVVRWDDVFKEWLIPDSVNQTVFRELAPQLTGDNQFSWSQRIEMPRGEHIALLVEEFEHMPTEVPTGTVEGGLVTFEPGSARRLVFSHLQRLP